MGYSLVNYRHTKERAPGGFARQASRTKLWIDWRRMLRTYLLEEVGKQWTNLNAPLINRSMRFVHSHRGMVFIVSSFAWLGHCMNNTAYGETSQKRTVHQEFGKYL